jgi:hypothetical protein
VNYCQSCLEAVLVLGKRVIANGPCVSIEERVCRDEMYSKTASLISSCHPWVFPSISPLPAWVQASNSTQVRQLIRPQRLQHAD